MQHVITRTPAGSYCLTNQGIKFVVNDESGQPGASLVLHGEDPRPDGNYDPEELASGLKEEMEHTDNPAIAAKIAKDHLDEDKEYYQKLKKAGL